MTPGRPIDVATRDTGAWVLAHVKPGATILEIGCGDGHFARELLDRGFQVAALDADEQSVTRARARGVAAVCTTWPEWNGDPVDAVAFTRSLHHIGALEAAVRKARDVLRPQGLLLVDDFAFDAIDAATLDWFAGVLRSARVASRLAPVPGSLVERLRSADDLAAAWRAHHAHDIHAPADMRRAIEASFTVRQARDAAYLYRYLVPALPETGEGAQIVEQVLREEERRVAAGAIVPIGRRVVATVRPT
jgi:SAM-dependent methyltransferase